jgi:hypothetical protein
MLLLIPLGAFYSFAMVLAAIAVVSSVVVPDPQTEKPGYTARSLADIARHLDLYGAVTGITALVLFNFAWNQAPIVGWDKAYVIVCLILGIMLVPTFFVSSMDSVHTRGIHGF